jgi:hypothetical protein
MIKPSFSFSKAKISALTSSMAAQGLVLVEVFVEADLVADLGFVEVDPGFRDVGFDFAEEVVVDAGAGFAHRFQGTLSLSRRSLSLS